MAEGFRDFVENLAFWEKAQEKEQMQILAGLDQVPQVAAKCFEAQYFELARRYEDFAVWANLQEHKKTKALIGSLSEYVQKQAALSKESKSAIDIGFAKMHDAVISIPETLKISQATEIADGLKRHYDKKVAEPIAEESESQGRQTASSLPSDKRSIHSAIFTSPALDKPSEELRGRSHLERIGASRRLRGLLAQLSQFTVQH